MIDTDVERIIREHQPREPLERNSDTALLDWVEQWRPLIVQEKSAIVVIAWPLKPRVIGKGKSLRDAIHDAISQQKLTGEQS